MANNYSNLSQFQSQQPQIQQPIQPQTSPLPQYNLQQYFPQPQGSIYMINGSSEAANVPISNGLSAAISLTEGTMVLKTIQNGTPMMLSYKLSPLDTTPSDTSSDKQILEYLKELNGRLTKIEEKLPKNGGRLECLN